MIHLTETEKVQRAAWNKDFFDAASFFGDREYHVEPAHGRGREKRVFIVKCNSPEIGKRTVIYELDDNRKIGQLVSH